MRLKFPWLILGLAFLSFCSSGATEIFDHTVTIVNFHCITKKTEGLSEYCRNEEDFKHDLDFLKSKGYDFLSIDDLYDAVEYGRPLRKTSIILNFDDALGEHYSIAFSALKNRKLKADFFIITNAIGDKNRLSWSEVQEMMAYEWDGTHPFTFGSHSVHHLQMGVKNANETDAEYGERIGKEFSESSDSMLAHLGVRPKSFALPLGSGVDQPQVIASALSAGYQVLRGTEPEQTSLIPGIAISSLRYIDIKNVTEIKLLKFE